MRTIKVSSFILVIFALIMLMSCKSSKPTKFKPKKSMYNTFKYNSKLRKKSKEISRHGCEVPYRLKHNSIVLFPN